MLVACKWCGFSKDVSPDLEGRKVSCPVCGKEFVASAAERRYSERQRVAHIFAWLDRDGKCEVRDLTLTGLSIYSYNMDSSYDIGTNISFNLVSGGNTVLTGLQAQIMHASPEAYGCKFTSLTDSQRTKLEQFIKEGLDQLDDTEGLNFSVAALEEFIDRTDED